MSIQLVSSTAVNHLLKKLPEGQSYVIMTTEWMRLVRFLPLSDECSPQQTPNALIGEPLDPTLDVGATTRQGKTLKVELYSGTSVLDPGHKTGRVVTAAVLLSPLDSREVGTLRGIALNYKSHARVTGLPIPKDPMMFMKPATALGDPYPSPTVLPKVGASHDAADYESELVIVIGKSCKNVTEGEAMKYVLGYTACNDVSSRTLQWEGKQWCFSKGFDTSCPIGPCIVSTTAVPDPSTFYLKGIHNHKVVQQSSLDDLIFTVPRLVSFLSQSTTLPPGTLILSGTPTGTAWTNADPKNWLRQGDEFSVEITPYIGTLTTCFVDEQ